ncbi:MAG: dipeptidase [Pyrobaculum sp.]
MKLVDLHQDIAFYYLTNINPPSFDKEAERHSDLPKLKRAGADVVFGAVFPFLNTYGGWAPSVEAALDALKVYWRLAKQHGVAVVEKPGDLDKPGLKLVLVLEGADVLREAGDLELFHRLGVRAIGLTWNVDNKWASSCYSKKDRGLTAEGEELLKEAERLGVIIDLAHASKQTALDVLQLWKKPLVISHANVKSVHNHPRNVDDEVLKALVDNGGVIGLTFIPSTISSQASIPHLAKHFKYVKEKFGVEVLAIGTDYLGISTTPPGLKSVDKIEALAKALVEEGFAKEEVEAVFWKNAMRVLKAYF